MAIDGFQLIQQLADRVAKLERRLDDTKTQPVESYTFSDIDAVLQHHQAYNNPQEARFEVRIDSNKYVTIRLIDEQFICKLFIGDSVTSVSLLMTEEANQVNIFIQAQKDNI